MKRGSFFAVLFSLALFGFGCGGDPSVHTDTEVVDDVLESGSEESGLEGEAIEGVQSEQNTPRFRSAAGYVLSRRVQSSVFKKELLYDSFGLQVVEREGRNILELAVVILGPSPILQASARVNSPGGGTKTLSDFVQKDVAIYHIPWELESPELYGLTRINENYYYSILSEDDEQNGVLLDRLRERLIDRRIYGGELLKGSLLVLSVPLDDFKKGDWSIASFEATDVNEDHYSYDLEGDFLEWFIENLTFVIDDVTYVPLVPRVLYDNTEIRFSRHGDYINTVIEFEVEVDPRASSLEVQRVRIDNPGNPEDFISAYPKPLQGDPQIAEYACTLNSCRVVLSPVRAGMFPPGEYYVWAVRVIDNFGNENLNRVFDKKPQERDLFTLENTSYGRPPRLSKSRSKVNVVREGQTYKFDFEVQFFDGGLEDEKVVRVDNYVWIISKDGNLSIWPNIEGRFKNCENNRCLLSWTLPASIMKEGSYYINRFEAETNFDREIRFDDNVDPYEAYGGLLTFKIDSNPDHVDSRPPALVERQMKLAVSKISDEFYEVSFKFLLESEHRDDFDFAIVDVQKPNDLGELSLHIKPENLDRNTGWVRISKKFKRTELPNGLYYLSSVFLHDQNGNRRRYVYQLDEAPSATVIK